MRALAALLGGCVVLSSPAVAQKTPTPVKFAAGKTFTTLKGSIKGYKSALFALDAVAGQTLHMLFKPSNRFCYFSVSRSGADGLVHDGTMDGNEFGANVQTNATYKIDIFLMRNAARRGERCRYELSVEVTGAPGGASAGVSDDTMRDQCKGATAPMYGVEPRKVAATGPVRKTSAGFTLDGVIDKGAEGMKKMRCIFRPDRTFDHVMAMTPDGE